MTVIDPDTTERLADRARDWGVDINETQETASSLVAFGTRGGDAVVLKIVKVPGDEWNAGDVLQAFDGHGMVRVLRTAPGAMLLEHLRPGTSLVELSASGRDTEAIDIFADVMDAMSPNAVHAASPDVAEWGRAFARYTDSDYRPLPTHLVEQAHVAFSLLVQSQTRPRLLHGDLQHSNVLFDSQRGWVAIDPKGVVGERDYEFGAVLRNPVGEPALFTSPAVIERRVTQFASRLGVDPDRTIAWAFAQAVLSAIWSIEDGDIAPQAWTPTLRLAEALVPMMSPRFIQL